MTRPHRPCYLRTVAWLARRSFEDKGNDGWWCSGSKARVTRRPRRCSPTVAVSLSSVVASQDAIHAPYGGVVPELASRRHLEVIVPVVEKALADASVRLPDLDGIAVTQGPGLVGSLLVGCSVAKSLAYVHRLPLVAVNHLEGHIYASFLTDDPPEHPFLALVVSGGHTALYHARGARTYTLVGQTRDDAAGEAFDKVAKLLGLGFPGGPVIERTADGRRSQGRHVSARPDERRRRRLLVQRDQDVGVPLRQAARAARGRRDRRRRGVVPGVGREDARAEDDQGRAAPRHQAPGADRRCGRQHALARRRSTRRPSSTAFACTSRPGISVPTTRR